MRPTVKLALNCPSCGNRYKMADDVYGHACPVQKAPGRWTRITVALGLFAGLQACATARPVPQVEAVGSMSAGPSVYSQPVHATTDVSHGFEQATVQKVDPAAVDADDVELPEVAAKDGGLTVGEVRQ